MASVKFILNLSIYFTLLLITTHQKTEAARRDSSNLLSILTSKLHRHGKPLIVILGKEAVLKKDRGYVNKALAHETSDEGGTVHLFHHLSGYPQAMNKAVHHKKSTRKPYQVDEKKKQSYWAQRETEERVLQKEDRDALRSPIVKKLLRISNSLRCEAKDECQDKCINKFFGQLKIKCQIQCDFKYECEPEKEKVDEKGDEKDPCDEDNENSCNSEEETSRGMSTKGVTSVTDEPGCKRC